MSEIRAALEELKGVAQEMHNLTKQIKELRLRKKELEGKVIEYLDTNDRNGVRLDNVIFVATEKSSSLRKKKAEVEKDAAEVLKRHGVQDVRGVLEELASVKKGESSTVPVLKMKAAGIFG
jgi:copper chaperone CopZ